MENVLEMSNEPVKAWFLNLDKLGRPSKVRRFKNRIAQILIECKTRTTQNHGSLVTRDPKGNIVTVCAMGLLALDQGLLSFGADLSDLGKVFNSLGYSNSTKSRVCSQRNCTQTFSAWSDYVVHLNDSHQKSFSQIGTIFNQVYLRQYKK